MTGVTVPVAAAVPVVSTTMARDAETAGVGMVPAMATASMVMAPVAAGKP